ncbi:MAG: arginine--tRNA ligase [Tissierellia bacterium]|nr:arginine--tRNA ligase [Tissierellia bacterium]
MINFVERIVDLLEKEIKDLNRDEINNLIEIPPDYTMGDYAFPGFSLAKIFRKNPALIAQDLANTLEDPCFEKIEAKGAYLNFFVNRELLAKEVIEEVKEKREDFGKVNVGENKPVIVEYSSPNIAKPFHIGHIRSTVIGDSLKRIYDFLGYDTISVNHLGDYGTQFGLMIEAYKNWGDRETVEKNPIQELVKLYVRINEEAKEQPELIDNARNWFMKLENKDEEALELWEWFRDVSLEEFGRVYDMLDVHFDSYRGESYYSDLMPAIVEELKEKDLLVDSQGAKIVDLEEYKLPPAIIIKSDGSTIYLTRDVTAAKYRKDTYDFYKNIYVVGSQQILHFNQLVAILDKMGYDWAYDCVHVPFGMVALEEGTLSTRRGNVLYLEDVLNKSVEKVQDILKAREEERGEALENRDQLAKQVGIGAVKFQELFNQRIKDYIFDWDKTLSFEGETGPYVQYTHARICSLLQRGNFNLEDDINTELLNKKEEIDILRSMYAFTDSVIDAHEKYEPYFITRYIVDLAKIFNKYYNSTTIITDDLELTKARLLLSYGIKNILSKGLELLGIEAPMKM